MAGANQRCAAPGNGLVIPLANRRDMVARFSMTLVQPGYSRANANLAHFPILGAVRSYLFQTYNIGLTFWSSP